MTDMQSEGPPGVDLRARRQELRMTQAQAAGDLLLSQRHVEALEADDPAAFYNHTFYQQARRRYAVLLGLYPPQEEPTRIGAGAQPEPAPPSTDLPAFDSAFPQRNASTRRRTAMMALVALGLAGWLIWQGGALLRILPGDQVTDSPQEPDTASLAAEVAPAMPGGASPATPPTAAEPTAENTRPPPAPLKKPTTREPTAGAGYSNAATTGDGDATEVVSADEAVYLFEAQRLSWVFARETSGKETRRTLKAGQKLALPGELRYLAIGDVTAVRLWVEGSERDLDGYSVDGRTARLGPPELRELRTGASQPGPADPY